MGSKMKFEIIETVTFRHVVTAIKSWPGNSRENEQEAVAHLEFMLKDRGLKNIIKKTEIVEFKHSGISRIDPNLIV